MSPVATRRNRGRRSYALAVGGILLALALAVVLFAFAVPAITSKNQTVSQAGGAILNEGSAKDRAADIAKSGPILVPDQAGGQRDIYIQHAGSSPNAGWLAFDARRAGQPRKCTLVWSKDDQVFRDPCGGADVPSDGSGLVHYRIVVDKDGDLIIDLNPNDETAGVQSGGTTTSVAPTTSSSTTTTIQITKP
jgi:hypothetical protein